MVKLAFVAALAGCSLSGLKNQCATQADCLDGFTCSAGTCVQLDGGMTCTPIGCDGKCGDIADHCGGTLTCGACPDHCMDNAQEAPETDLDCGGDCMPCDLGQHCSVPSDCATGTCDAGTCRAGTWSTSMAMPTPRSEIAAVAADDGKIYVIGGLVGGSASSVVEAYDPGANSWTTRAPMLTPRYGLSAVLGSDHKIYAIGGNYASAGNAGASVIAEVYDPATNAWASLPSLPIGRYQLAAAFVGDTVYATGGYDGATGHVLGTVAALQIGAASWTILPDAMTTARHDHAAIAMPDGKIYAAGGMHDLVGDELDAFEVMQPGTPGWNTATPMPTPRKSLAFAALGASLYAISGSPYVGTGQQYTRVVEVYDTVGHTWSQVTSLPLGRFDAAAVSLGGKIYVIGGHRETATGSTASVDVFTP